MSLHIWPLVLFIVFGFIQMDNRLVLLPEPESTIWIEGSTNVNNFQCEALGFEGFGRMEPDAAHAGTREMEQGDLEIMAAIHINKFDCGQRRMNRDLYKTLKGDDHPQIIFTFVEGARVTTSQDYIFEVTGELTVAGTTREIIFEVDGNYHNDAQWQATGKADISMEEFNLDPPSPLMGLIKVDDRLTVNFDLIVTINKHKKLEEYE